MSGDPGRTDAQQQQPEEQSKFPLSEIETELTGLHTTASLVGHLATSDFEVGTEVLNHIEDQINAHRERLKALWKQVWEEQKRGSEAHEVALAAAKARVAPGSPADLEHVAGLWGLLAAAAQVVLERAREAMPEGTRLLVMTPRFATRSRRSTAAGRRPRVGGSE